MLFFILLIFNLILFCAGEVVNWKTVYTEFNPNNGVCSVNEGQDLIPKNVPPSTDGFCGDKFYGLLKYCAQKSFYDNLNRPRHQYSGTANQSALYFINGCLQCSYGKAVAIVRLVNHLQSGSLFSRCGKEDKTISNVSVKLNSAKSNFGFGSFSVGGILEGRKCGGLFNNYRETLFSKMVLEIEHNCGQKKPMKLYVLLPPVDLQKLIKEKGHFREWDGIHVNLAVFGLGWNERWLDFGDVYHSVSKKIKPTEVVSIFNKNLNVIQKEEKSQGNVLPTPVEFIEEGKKNNEEMNKNYLFELNPTIIFVFIMVPILLGFSFNFFKYLFSSRFFKHSNKSEKDYELGGESPSMTSPTLSQGTTHSSLILYPLLFYPLNI
ncbi:hypothetical protein Mgra_00006061 [Meloidogyne graminicola]|uniref:Uncharacterized protein n=1 Tax=Meloidogyne graminicola TaxID=189291 RepID=A0A8S9ZM84_9BILA|nr:hypothetical protein Mgra_00006061 [Meloidogyne graminicola]